MADTIHFVHGVLNVGEAMSTPLIRQVKATRIESDLQIIDSPPRTSCPVIESVRGADLVLLVTEPTPFGLNDLELAVEMVKALRLPLAGLAALDQALGLRMYRLINAQRTELSEGRERLRLIVDVCRVQEARRRKGLPDFPCKGVGQIEFEIFARTVDSRIQTRCLHCPPGAVSNQYCGWEFSLHLSEGR
jgi:hypothetical protein